MPTAADITRMRATVTASLPDTATILRRTLSNDGKGGKTTTYTSVGTTPAALAFDSRNPDQPDRAVGEKTSPQQRWIVTVPAGADVRETDRLTINGTTFDVLSSAATRSRELDKRFLVKKV